MRSDKIKAGYDRAGHRSLLRAMGVKEEDFGKPFIAIVNSYADIVGGHVHLQAFGKRIKEAVRVAGGVPFEFNTIAVDDGIVMGHAGMKYSLPSRELIADCVETMVESHQFDGMVCIPNCDKIVPGMLMAALRVDIPTIFVSGGAMPAGKTPQGETIDLISVFEAVGAYSAGKIDENRLKTLEKYACPSCGSCSGLFTANSMNCLMEVLGLALPFNGTALANSPERQKLAEQAAKQILKLIEMNLTPRQLLTIDAIDDAFTLDMAMGGSSNTLLHTLAFAHEVSIHYPLKRVNAIADTTPYLTKISPSGPWHIEDLQRAGGMPALLNELAKGGSKLHLDRMTVSGMTLGESIDGINIRDYDVIRPYENPHSTCGGLSVLFGNLAPEGAAVKTGGVPASLHRFSGPARIFESQDEACEKILKRQFQAGDVIVIRYEGPRGGPGMQEMLSPTSAIMGMDMGEKVSLITDGRFSGGTRGLCIGHISPEAAARGPIAALQDGDVIDIDLNTRSLNVRLNPEIIQSRLEALPPFELQNKSPWLQRYARHVTSASRGAVLL